MGFLHKVVGAFVERADGSDQPEEISPALSLDDITNDAAGLMAQLDDVQASEPSFAVASISPKEDVPILRKTDLTAEEVFVAAGLASGSNSAPRLLKLIAGLSMFPKEQQVVMVRAMDAADDSWSESDVLEDARTRQSVLRAHLEKTVEACKQEITAIDQRIAAAQEEGNQIVADIDRRIEELQRKRQETLTTTSGVVVSLESQKKVLEEETGKGRKGIATVINALSSLLTFFGTPR